MEASLRHLLPRMLGPVSHQIFVHQDKDDLLKVLPERLQGYASWIPEKWRIVVIVDRDDDDCQELKARLDSAATAAGFTTDETQSVSQSRTFVSRLAIEELEAWYFGDWTAVRSVYPRVPKTIPSRARYRDPDAIKGGTWEAFERVLKRAGYFKNGLRKVEASKAIAEQMDPERNTSTSFRKLREVLTAMRDAGQQHS